MASDSPELKPVCPAARAFAGATPGDGGIVCGVMEDEAKRADSVTEGAPVGVEIKVRESPSTIANFCCGSGEPLTDPDDLPKRAWGQGHYTGCPIWAAVQERKEAYKRLFPFERPDPDAPPEIAGKMTPATDAEMREMDLAWLED